MPKQVLAIALCRVSSIEQLENNSLNRQREAVLNAAEELSVTIPDDGWWSGSISSKRGTNVERKDLQEMIDRCKKDKRIKYVIVDEPDRFMRSIDEAAYFEVTFRQLGVTVWYASDPELNKGDLASKLLKFTKYLSAEGSNEERQNKSIAGQTKALLEGRYPFSPKPGYKRGYERGIQEKRQPHADILRACFLDILARRVTPTQALIAFNKSEFFAGGKAHYKMDKFRKIVTDPFYAGIVEINVQVKVRNENGLHEPLITKDQHYELVRIMNDKHKNQKGPHKNGNPKYPLSNLVTHEPCSDHRIGRVVGYDHGNGRSKTLVYEKYRCRACATYVTREHLHNEVKKLFGQTKITQDGLKNLKQALDKVWLLKEGQAEQEAHRINHKIKALQESIINQVEAATDPGNITIKEDILKSIASKKLEIEHLESDLELVHEKVEADKDRFLDFAFGYIGKMGDRFLELPLGNRMRCKQLLFPGGIYLGAGKKVYTTEMSILYRLATKKKDAEASDNSHLVRVRGL